MTSKRERTKRPTAAMSAARSQLIEIQKRWVADLKERIYETESRHNPQLDAYYDEYREHFQEGYESTLSREKVAKRLSNSDIAYFGDFHTLKLAQTTYITLVEEVIEDYERPVVLALEMVESSNQRFIDAFLRNDLSEEEFLEAIEYEESWGFHWPNYRRIFDLARKHSLPVIGINLNADGKKESLFLRDQHAARLIAALRVFNPDALIAVLFGDLHIGENHLPKAVRAKLAELSTNAREMILYQNSETFYWDLVEKGRESGVDAVKVRPKVYCIMNATPLAKFQSWVAWQDRDIDMREVGSDQTTWTDMKSQLAEVIETIDEFFALDAKGRDKFSLYASENLYFLSDLANAKPAEKALIREMIAAGRSVILASTRTLYLASQALNESAWLAASFLRLCCVGAHEFERAFEPRDAFYVSVFDEALGTVGTLVMNPRYRVMTPLDHESLVFSFKGRRKLSDPERLSRQTSLSFLEHFDMIEKRLAGDSRANLRSIYRLQPAEYMALTRAIGRYLGACLFQSLHFGSMETSTLGELFRKKWQKREPFEYFLETRESLGALPDILRPISESL